MTVLRFPDKSANIPSAPPIIHICAPSHEDLLPATRKFGFGYTKKEAKTRFYDGGANLQIETTVHNLAKAPDWLKFWLVSQFLLYVEAKQPLSPIEEDAFQRLGDDPYKYGKGLRKPKKPRR